MMRIAVVALAGVALGGCGLAAKVEARNDYQASEGQYKTCLAANPATPQNCEGLRLAMEADERKFQNMSAGTAGGSRSGTVTILNR